VVTKEQDSSMTMLLPLHPPLPVPENIKDNVQRLASEALSGLHQPIELALAPGLKYLVVRIAGGREAVEELPMPDGNAMMKMDNGDNVMRNSSHKTIFNAHLSIIIVIIVTSKEESPPYNFVSRVFAHWSGVPEDPVTGSAHSILASFWSERLHQKSFFARQCSKRGGELHLKLREDGCEVRGEAVIVLRGELDIA